MKAQIQLMSYGILTVLGATRGTVQREKERVSALALFYTGTEYVSSIWNSAGSSLLKLVLDDRRLRNIFNKSMFSPVTFEI